MNFFLYSLAALSGLSLIIAVVYPCFVICVSEHKSHNFVTLTNLHFISIFVALVILCIAFGISLTDRGANVTIVSFAFVCAGFLALFSFNLRFKLFGLGLPIVGPLALIGIAISIVFVYSGVSRDSEKIIEIGDGIYCKRSPYGFVSTDSGIELEAFKRYPFIDKSVVTHMQSDIYPNETNTLSSAQIEIVKRCEDAFSKITNTPVDSSALHMAPTRTP